MYNLVIVESIKGRKVLFIFADDDATWTFDVHFVSVLIMFLYSNSAFRYQLSLQQLKELPFDFILVAKKASELINAENL